MSNENITFCEKGELLVETLEDQEWIDNVEKARKEPRISELAPQGICYRETIHKNVLDTEDREFIENVAVYGARELLGWKMVELKNKAVLETTARIGKDVGKDRYGIVFYIRTVEVEVEEL